jgi:hypothetical protein
MPPSHQSRATTELHDRPALVLISLVKGEKMATQYSRTSRASQASRSVQAPSTARSPRSTTTDSSRHSPPTIAAAAGPTGSQPPAALLSTHTLPSPRGSPASVCAGSDEAGEPFHARKIVTRLRPSDASDLAYRQRRL